MDTDKATATSVRTAELRIDWTWTTTNNLDMRTPKTQQELVESSEHLHYELHMMRDTAKLVQACMTLLEQGVREVIQNALLESFLLHTRSLLHFLYSNDLRALARQDDFVAQDYLPGFSARCPQSLAQAYERINKEIAHLTGERSRKKDKQWEFVTIAKEVEDEVANFLVQVPDAKLEKGIRAYKQSRLAPPPPAHPITTRSPSSAITSARTTADPSRAYGLKC